MLHKEIMGRKMGKALKRGKAVWIHKWLSLFFGVFFLCEAATGVVLIYRDEITNLQEFPEEVPHASSHYNEGDTLNRVTDMLREEYPDRAIQRIDFPTPSRPLFLGKLRDQKGNVEYIKVMPLHGKLYRQGAASDFMDVLFDLHVNFLSGTTGHYLVGGVGIILCVVIVVGFIVSWPAVKHFRKLFRVSFGNLNRTLFELHRAVGLISLVVVCMLSFTGVMLVFGQQIKPLFKINAPARVVIEEGKKALPNDVLLAKARQVFPEAKIRNVRFLSNAVLYRVVFHRGSAVNSGPASQVWLDPVTGRVEARKDAENLTFGEGFFSWMYPLHVDLALGHPGKLINFIGGLSVFILAISGVWFWWRRKKFKPLKYGFFKRNRNAGLLREG